MMCIIPINDIKKIHPKILKFSHSGANKRSKLALAPIFGHTRFGPLGDHVYYAN